MTSTPENLRPWLGHAWDDLTEEQRDRLAVDADLIAARYPDPDDAERHQAALTAAVQYLLGDTTIEDAGRALTSARLRVADAMAASQQIAAMAVADGMSEVAAAQATAIDRMTLRKVLGKR